MDLPLAREIAGSQEIFGVGYKNQKEAISQRLREMNSANNSIKMEFQDLPDKDLVRELEESGYVVNFVTSYKEGSYKTSIKIQNPEYQKITPRRFAENIIDTTLHLVKSQ